MTAETGRHSVKVSLEGSAGGSDQGQGEGQGEGQGSGKQGSQHHERDPVRSQWPVGSNAPFAAGRIKPVKHELVKYWLELRIERLR